MPNNPLDSLGRVVAALIGVAAVLVSIAAVVYIVDTVRDDGDGDGASVQRDLSNGANRDLDGADRAFGGLDDRLLVRAGSLLGVSVEEQDGALAVQDVLPGSPADEAGIEAGDVISEVDGEPVASVTELREALAAVEPGESYELTVATDGDERAVAVTRPEAGTFDRFVVSGGSPLLGVTTEDSDEGVRVVSVLPGFGAEEAGVAAGDVIRSVDGTPVEMVAELRELLADREADEVVSVELARDDEPLEASVALSAPRASVGGVFGFGDQGGRRFFNFGDGEGFDGLTPDQFDEYGFFLEGLDPEQRERLERIIEQLLENGYTPPPPLPGQRPPSGA